MAVVGERELSARERRMVHMTSDIFGGVDKSVYSTKAQKEMLANLKETFKYVKQVHVPESMNLPSAGEQKKKLMAGNQAVLPGSTTNGPSAAKRDPEFMPKEFWYTLVDLQWHDVRNERCRHKNQMAERVNLGAKEKYLREMSSELFEKVLSSYFGHLKLSTIDPMAVFFKVSEQNELRTEDWKKGQAMLRACGMTDLEGDVALFQDLLRYAKLADVAYAGDEESLRQQLAALQWRFVTGSCEAKPQRPAHFLAMQGKKVLLGVAGTHTIADCLTDCLCDSSPFQVGFAHRGAARASAWLCEEYGESLKYLEENGYEVVLVGHSLGAAVAAACCVQLRAGPGALRTARCVCYAPPATVDPNQAAEAASYITSVVHDDDCIPRMSILSLLELYKSLVSYNWLPKATGLVGKMRADPQQAWFLELGDNAFRKTLEEQLESIWKEQAGQLVEEVKKLEKPRQEAHPLSIPGFIVHLYRCPGGYGIIKALDSNFRSIELSSSMVTDHFLSNYISALETLTAGVSASHHSKLQRLRDFLGDGDDVAEVAVQVHEVAKSVEELVLKARAKLQQRPDTS